MDAEMDRRWRANEPPFDGVRLAPDALLPVADLSAAITVVTDHLSRSMSPDSRLWFVEDWHEHDGYVKKAEPASWQMIREWSKRENLRPGDTYVRAAFFPDSRSFYFRYYVADEEPGEAMEGEFDLTGPKPLIDSTALALAEAGYHALTIESAKLYFDRAAG